MEDEIAISIDIDKDQLCKAASQLSEKTAVDELASDPPEFMARFGIAIDEETATAIRSRLTGERYAKTAASILHVDMPA